MRVSGGLELVRGVSNLSLVYSMLSLRVFSLRSIGNLVGILSVLRKDVDQKATRLGLAWVVHHGSSSS